MTQHLTKLRVGYTRSGRTLHAVNTSNGKTGKRVCDGGTGYVHPHYDSDDVPVALSLSINGGCSRCLRKLDSEA